MSFLQWLEAMPLSVWTRESDYGFYINLAGHGIGMAIVAGFALTLSFRVLGFSSRTPVAAFAELIGVAWAGFFLSLVTGLLLFAAAAPALAVNAAFVTKIALLLGGGVALWALWNSLRAQPAVLEGGQARGSTKGIAVVAIAAWTAVIVAGRLSGYASGF